MTWNRVACVAVVAIGAGSGSCRAASRPAPAPGDREQFDARAAPTPSSCRERIVSFREQLAAAPTERIWADQDRHAPPEIAVSMAPVGTVLRPLILITQTEVIVWGLQLPLAAFAPTRFDARFEQVYRELTEPLVYLKVDRGARLSGVRDVRDAIGRAERTMKREFFIGLWFRWPTGSFEQYEPPVVIPPWARAEVLALRERDVLDRTRARRALARAAPRCSEAADAGTAMMDAGAHDPTLEASLIDALTACDCSQIDLDAFAGLVLGAIGYRNPYGYVRLATTPKAKHRIKVSSAGTMVDLAAAWPTDAGAEAVWVDFE